MKVKTLVTLIFVHLIVICYAQIHNIGHINMKVNRLNRITNGLLKEVDEIWKAISTFDISDHDIHNLTSEGTVEVRTHNAIKQVNETVSYVWELKTEVEELVVIAKNWLKNGKKFNHEKLQNITRNYQEFQASINAKNQEMKRNLDSLLQELSNFQAEYMMYHQMVENTSKAFDERLSSSENEIKSFYDKHQNISRRLESLENRTLDSVERSQENEHKIEVYQSQHNNLSNILVNLEKKQDIESHKTQDKLTEILTKFDALTACEPDWTSFAFHCYQFQSQMKTWDEAVAYCESKNSYLVELTTDEEVRFVAELSSGNKIHTGANDRDKEGTFVWEKSKQQVPKKFWLPGEPNNSQQKEHCAEMVSHQGANFGKFNDIPCHIPVKFVCEKLLLVSY